MQEHVQVLEAPSRRPVAFWVMFWQMDFKATGLECLTLDISAESHVEIYHPQLEGPQPSGKSRSVET